MATPRSHGSDLVKKTRATSCTCCRQVKLKCDLKERYPNPCTRCATNNSECRTDSSFKRVPARSRIKDLESQIDRLKRNQTFAQASTPRPFGELSPEPLYRTPSYTHLEEPYTGYASSDRISYGSPSGSEMSRNELKWLNIPESDPPLQFTLQDFVLPYAHAYDLFSHFEEQYYQHFCILEPVFSLHQLTTDSEFLFWAIALVASRNHARHTFHFEHIRSRISSLYHAVAVAEMQSLLDLQAFLLLCSFDCRILGQSHDMGWLQLGMAVNAAREMGLDKDKEEIMFDSRTAQHSLIQHPRHIRQMTWMKCFELDVQSSCWHGHLPTLGYPHCTRTIARFCESLPVKVGYAAIVSIHVELAQSLLALEESPASGSEGPSFLVRMFNERFNTLKSKWSSVWSLDAEIELLTAKIYLYGACLVSPEEPCIRRRGDGFYLEALQTGQNIAVQLATLLTNIHAESTANLGSLGFASNSWPLPGRPRHHTQSAVFSTAVLLKYLDDPQSSAEDEGEAARNAFVKVYQMFAPCTASVSEEHQSTARMLEAAGRAIGTGRGQMQSHVTTRMAASLRLNMIRLANHLRTGEQSSEQQMPGADFAIGGPGMVPSSTLPPASAYGDYEQLYAATTCAASVDAIFNEPIWASSTMPGVTLGYEAWDNTAFDNWQQTIPYPTSTGFESMPMAYTRA